MVFSWFRPVSPRLTTGSGLPTPLGSGNGSPSTQSEFFFYNLLLCSIAAQVEVQSGGSFDPADSNTAMFTASNWLASCWAQTGDFY